MNVWRGWNLARVALDRAGAGGAAEWRSATIVADEKQGLGRVVRIRTWLAHELSGYFNTAVCGGTLVRVTFNGFPSSRSAVKIREQIGIGLCLLLLTACGPRARIPPRPLNLPGALAPTDSGAVLARRLAPLLYLQRDETFQLARAAAFLHPERRVIAYHLLWFEDLHGSWLPRTVPTDEEVIWVGYDSTGAPTELWTYWHTRILHTKWPKSQVVLNVQWGQHGSFPRGMRESDLPRSATLNVFYAMSILAFPDMLLGNLTRRGPLCFCRSYRRYRDFSRPFFLGDRLDAVAITKDPHPVLTEIFGKHYSNKDWWPWPPPY